MRSCMARSRQILGLAIGLCAQFASGCSASTIRSAEAFPFELRHGVIVDPGRDAIYLGTPGGSVEAIELSTGRSLWSSNEAALPLTLQGRHLLAQGEEPQPGQRLPIALLDVESGGRKVAGETMSLPEGVRAHVNDRLGRTFRASARHDGEGFIVSWSYRETLVSGVARELGEAPPERSLSGSARVVGGGVAANGGSSSATERCAEQAATAKIRESGSFPPESASCAGNVVAVTEGGRGGALVLRRWDALSLAALPDRVLSERALLALASADERHILVSERVGSGEPGDPEYRWSIVSTETGDPIGQVRRDVSAAPFFLRNDAVIFESQPHGFRRGDAWIDEPLEIVAVRLPNGAPVWERAIRDLEYRGTMPPAPPQGAGNQQQHDTVIRQGRS